MPLTATRNSAPLRFAPSSHVMADVGLIGGFLMTWEILQLEDKYNRDQRPFISISRHRISFSASFVRLIGIGTQHRVTIHADDDTMRLGFEFHADEKPHSLALSQDGRSRSKQSGLFCSSHGAVNKFEWVSGITKLSSKDRRFYPKKEGTLWVITLCPSFEKRYARESQNIPRDANGIYRYVRENGQVVYIGRGKIYRRLQSPERLEWDFDVIECSIIDDPDQQIYWEKFWIDKFKEKNGQLPFYNKVSGINSVKQTDDVH